MWGCPKRILDNSRDGGKTEEKDENSRHYKPRNTTRCERNGRKMGRFERGRLTIAYERLRFLDEQKIFT